MFYKISAIFQTLISNSALYFPFTNRLRILQKKFNLAHCSSKKKIVSFFTTFCLKLAELSHTALRYICISLTWVLVARCDRPCQGHTSGGSLRPCKPYTPQCSLHESADELGNLRYKFSKINFYILLHYKKTTTINWFNFSCHYNKIYLLIKFLNV